MYYILIPWYQNKGSHLLHNSFQKVSIWTRKKAQNGIHTIDLALAKTNREATSGSQRHWFYVCALKAGYESGF